jgi:hypothetical protein
MSLIKKIDIEKHYAARRAMRLGRTAAMSQLGARMESAAKANSAPASPKDGATGHSSPSTSFTLNQIAADSDGAHVSATPRNRQA